MIPKANDAVSANHTKTGNYQENDTSPEPLLRANIQRFVRGVLGCSCPEAVFQTIHIDYNPRALVGTQRGYTITIGSKLLVLVIMTTNCPVTVNELGNILERGRQARDRERLNRFRLVVATPEPQLARSKLESGFEALGMQDNRIHLHIVSPDQLPVGKRYAG